MTHTLPNWLRQQQSRLLPDWATVLATAAVPASAGAQAELPEAVRDGLQPLFEALLQLLDAPAQPIQPALAALPLEQQIAALHALRRSANALLNDHPAALLAEELSLAIDQSVAVLVAGWSAETEAVVRDQQFITESLAQANEEADRVAIQLSRLNEIARLLASSLETDALIEQFGSQLYDLLGIRHLSIWQFDEQQLYAAQSWGAELRGQRLDLLNQPHDLLARTVQRAAPLLLVALEPKDQGPWYQPGCAVLAVPLLVKQTVSGLLVLQDPDPASAFSRRQQDLLSSLASQAAITLENARLYADLELRVAARTAELAAERDRLEALYGIALEVSSSLDLGRLLQNSLSAVARIVAVPHGSIMILEQDTQQLVDRAVLGKTAGLGFVRFSIGQGISGWVAQHRKPTIVDDVSADPRWIHLPGDDTGKRQGSMLVVPLIAHDLMLGVLQLSHPQNGYFDESHLKLVSACANQIAIAINNARLYEDIEQQYLHQGEILRRQELEASQKGAILQSLSDGVIVCDINGSVLLANTAAEQILERPLDELLTWNLRDLFARLLGKRASELPIDELISRPINQRGPRIFRSTFPIGVRTISTTLGPVIAENTGLAGDELIGAVTVFRDITREVESDRLKTEFIGTVSHELRTPMTSIKGFTQLLTMGSLGPVNDTQREFLTTILHNAERMISIINDLLDITKLETGSVELEFRPVHMAETISAVVAELQAALHNRGQQLTLTIAAGMPLVRADTTRVHQILYNLLTNAIKYTPRDGKIWIESREIGFDQIPQLQREQLQPHRRYVLTLVRDTGVGIAAHELDRIFERFYRTENPLKVEAGGTGLGLSLVKPLTALLGGAIWVESEPGEGSCFSVVLPAA